SAPKVLGPSITTWLCSQEPGPSTTLSPITQYGPISQPSPIFAPGWTIAVGWIMDLGGERESGVHNAKEHLRFGDDLVVHDAAALCLGQSLLVLRHLHFDEDGVAGNHRLAELHAVCRHEVADLARVARLAQQQDASHLRHGFQLQHARHDRMPREVA